jgi:hypothetical protein
MWNISGLVGKSIICTQSWAPEAMKQRDEALNASSLQFLCQR